MTRPASMRFRETRTYSTNCGRRDGKRFRTRNGMRTAKLRTSTLNLKTATTPGFWLQQRNCGFHVVPVTQIQQFMYFKVEGASGIWFWARNRTSTKLEGARQAGWTTKSRRRIHQENGSLLSDTFLLRASGQRTFCVTRRCGRAWIRTSRLYWLVGVRSSVETSILHLGSKRTKTGLR